ncbi:MFS transporter [Actibacterium sp. D379-3]
MEQRQPGPDGSAVATAAAEPEQSPAPPAAPPFTPMPLPRAAAYVLASIMLGLSQGLGQGFVSANLQTIAGEIGATQTEAIWLMAAYMAPRASLPLLLIKIRTQYGLRAFAEVGIVFYVVAAGMSLMVSDLHSAIAVQFISGCAAAPLSTLAFFYMLEPLPPKLKMSMGLSLALTVIMLGTPLARVITPELLSYASWSSVLVMGLGMALTALALVFMLPLAPQPRAKVISALDIVVYLLIAVALGGLTVTFLMGATYWWTSAQWLGELLFVSLCAGTVAAVIELNRKAPLLDIHWLASPAILHLTGALLTFRIILSEQSSGAPGLFRALGMGPEQLKPLFVVIVLASLAGGVACAILLKPGREEKFHIVALALIAVGAFMDSHATSLTRPEQMYVSQGMIAFASALFLPPALLNGLLSALAKGPQYLLSFVIVFLTTQSVGGVMGSGLFTTFINHRRAFHSQVLSEQLIIGDPALSARIGQIGAQYASSLPDPALRSAQAVSSIGGELSTQAYVLAYNDAFLALSSVATAALCVLLIHFGALRFLEHRAGAATPA